MLADDATFGQDDLEVIHTESRYDGFFKIQSLKLRHRLFAGGWGPELNRELFVRGSATCLLPYDPEQDAVVLCEQFRVGAIREGMSPWLLELVAGMNDPGESPQQVAIREAEEEAGLKIRVLKPICQYFPSPGGSSEWIDLFCGLVSVAGVGGIHGLEEEGEDIRVHVMSRQDAYGLVKSGAINNAASIIGLQWLELNHEQLQHEWLNLT